jgi:hypothetical protein
MIPKKEIACLYPAWAPTRLGPSAVAHARPCLGPALAAASCLGLFFVQTQSSEFQTQECPFWAVYHFVASGPGKVGMRLLLENAVWTPELTVP